MAAHEVDRQKESQAAARRHAEEQEEEERGSSEKRTAKSAPPNPMMLGLTPSAYVLRSVRGPHSRPSSSVLCKMCE